MAWYSQIGFDEGIMKKVDPENKIRQMFIFSILVVMIIIVSFFVLVSSIIYLLVIFHNWFIAIGAGLFLSLVVFNIYLRRREERKGREFVLCNIFLV